MNIADICLVILIVAALEQGLHLGLIRQTSIALCVFAGLVITALVQSRLASLATNPPPVLLFISFLILGLLIVGLFFDIGWVLGKLITREISRFHRFVIADKIAGVIVAGLAALLVLRLGAALFIHIPNVLIAAQVQHSVLLNGLQEAVPVVPDVFIEAGNMLGTHAFPRVFTTADPAPATTNTVSGNQIKQLAQVVKNTESSVVRITGNGCGGTTVGSGFVAAENLVVTNAHVVSGIAEPFVEDKDGQHTAQVALFDPGLDIAVLRTTNLSAKPLPINQARLQRGEIGVVMGYSSGSLGANEAVLTAETLANGYDIYNQAQVQRTIYALHARIEHGDSGGPFVNRAGEVVGIIFAKSASLAEVGYSLPANQIAQRIAAAQLQLGYVSTGACAN